MPDRLEVEAKFPIEDPDAFRTALTHAGAIPQGRHEEFNIRLDDDRRTLTERRIVLRLRRTMLDGQPQHLLTLKTDVQGEDSAIMARREIELTIGDIDTMEALLGVLGYVPYWRYEKRREVFTWRRTETVLDEMPYGWFMEIEGQEEDIRALAEKLNLDLADSIPYSYSQIFNHICENLGIELTDLTFEEFADIDVPREAYYPPAKD